MLSQLLNGNGTNLLSEDEVCFGGVKVSDDKCLEVVLHQILDLSLSEASSMQPFNHHIDHVGAASIASGEGLDALLFRTTKV